MRAVRTVIRDPIAGSGYRSRAAHRVTPGRLSGCHGPPRTLPIRLAGQGRVRWAAVRAIREECQNLPDRPWLADERNAPDVAAAPRDLSGNFSSHPRHQFCPGNSGSVLSAGLVTSVAAACLRRSPGGGGRYPTQRSPSRQSEAASPRISAHGAEKSRARGGHTVLFRASSNGYRAGTPKW